MTFTLLSFESRRAQEIARLIERQGAVAMVAPSMKETPLVDPSLARFDRALAARQVDALILLTGVGTRMLVSALATERSAEPADVVEQLRAISIGARGPKVFAALKELRIAQYVAANEPYEWTDLATALETGWKLSGLRVWLQEYGTPHPDFVAWLTERGAVVDCVRVYQWERPTDMQPLHQAIDALLARQVHAVLFTSAPQVERVLEIAREKGLENDVREALSHAQLGSIGPSCSARLRKLGIRVDVEPEHSHMGHLVKAVLERLKGSEV